jgi:hypothetical protein
VQVRYVGTWSSYNTFRRQHADQADPLIAFQQQLLAAMGTEDAGTTVEVHTPLVLLLAQQPVPVQ